VLWYEAYDTLATITSTLCRIQRAWKKYQNLKEHAHPQLKGQDQQDDSVVLDNCNILSIEEQFKAGACDTTSSYSTHKQSSSHHLHARNTVELLDTEPTTIPQAATPTNNELNFEVSADHPLYNSDCKEVLNSECSASTEHKLNNKQKLNCTLIHPVEHFGLENSLNSGTNHDITLPTTVKSLDDKEFAMNSKEKVDSLDDRYHLCYTIELSDSSADEDKNWQAGQNFPDTAVVAAGYNLVMECNTDCGRLYNHSGVKDINTDNESLTILHFAELDDFISDDQQQYTSHFVQADHENVSPSKWKVLDHSFSPLHAMTLQQLRQLFLSLERQLSGK
jgi:hypothetical protein